MNEDVDEAEDEDDNYPPPPLRSSLRAPTLNWGSLTLIRHKMTLSHFSKGLIRPVSGGQKNEDDDDDG